jgi:hypothetical protein
MSEDERQLTAIHELLEQGQAMREAYEKAKAEGTITSGFNFTNTSFGPGKTGPLNSSRMQNWHMLSTNTQFKA